MDFINGNIWEIIKVTVLAADIPILLFLWVRIDSVRTIAKKDAEEAARAAIAPFSEFRRNADKVNGDQWTAINEVNKQIMDVMKQLHAHELFVRDHFVTHKALDDSLESILARFNERLDTLRKAIDDTTAAVRHLSEMRHPKR